MPHYRVKLTMASNIFGGGEVYISPNQSGQTAATTIQTMLEARMRLFYDYHQVTGVSLAVEGSRRRSRFLEPGTWQWPAPGNTITIPAQGTRTGTGRDTRADQWRAALQYALTFDESRTTMRYMAGIPDAVSSREPGTIDWGGSTSYEKDTRAFFDLLVSAGWQIKGRTKPTTVIIDGPTDAELPVVGLVKQEASPSLTGIILDAVPPPLLDRRDKVHLRNFRHKPVQKPSINGIWTVHSVNTTLVPGSIVFWLLASQAVDISKVKQMGTAQRVRFTLFPVQRADAVRIGMHKRGGPLPQRRGRRLTRVSLDP